MGWRSFGSPADGVRDDPWCAGEGDANGVAGPVEMVVWGGEELRKPDHNLRCGKGCSHTTQISVMVISLQASALFQSVRPIPELQDF